MAMDFISRLLKLSLLIGLGLNAVSAVQPSVNINSSRIYGLETQVDNTTVHKYLGIRFGEPPVGDLRFSKPLPAALPAELNATQHGSFCPSEISEESEDCLFLDVYVPVIGNQTENGTKSLLPVMVWIYSGGFVLGANSLYNGSRLAAEQGVIVVILNYRLGPFGFMSTGDNSSLGNYGLWDQWLALKWVHDNIEPFGGNASLVTLFGQSAGGASTTYHLTSPHSSNLFQRAIMQSGCRLCPWAYNATDQPQVATKQLAAALQCNTSDSASLVACLREIPFALVRNASLEIIGWVPVVDGDFVLSYNLDQHQKFSGPIMSGLNNYEGGIVWWLLRMFPKGELTNRTYYREVALQQLLNQVHHSLVASADLKAVTQAADVLDCVYRENTSNDTTVSVTELESISGEVNFFVCNQQFLDSQPSTQDLFLYYFDHYPEVPGGEKGMSHGLDQFYTFGFDGGANDPYTIFNMQNISSNDLRLAASFRTLLANFAKTGNPKQGSELPNWPAWPPYTKGDKSYLTVTNTPTVNSHLNKDKMTIWLETIPSLLRSKGPAHIEDTPWHHCYKDDTGSANSNFDPRIYIVFYLLVTSMSLVL